MPTRTLRSVPKKAGSLYPAGMTSIKEERRTVVLAMAAHPCPISTLGEIQQISMTVRWGRPRGNLPRQKSRALGALTGFPPSRSRDRGRRRFRGWSAGWVSLSVLGRGTTCCHVSVIIHRHVCALKSPPLQLFSLPISQLDSQRETWGMGYQRASGIPEVPISNDVERVIVRRL